MQTKECSRCKTTKPASEFYFCKRDNRLHSRCKNCSNADAMEWARNNKDKVNASARKHYQKIKDTEQQKEYLEQTRDTRNERCKKYNAENRERIKISATRWKAANSEKIKISDKKWRDENPERMKVLQTRWCVENPEKVRASSNKRRALVKQADGSFTGTDIYALLRQQRGKCVACGVNIKKAYHVDHIMPLALGGHNGITNIQLLCPHCNQSKSAKHPVDFMQSRGFLL